MNKDPFDLDQTEFAKVVRDIYDNSLADELPEEPPHPLLKSPPVAALCDHLRQRQVELFEARKPGGGMGDDAYFRFNEGLELRPEVVARLVIDYVKQHPEVFSE
jgi:hypothetical protein